MDKKSTSNSPPDDGRYHKTPSAYVLPNDGLERARLDSQAAAIVEAIGGSPFLAPIQTIQGKAKKAVDIGCGTGTATLQMANAFKSAQVYGLDISPVPEFVQKDAPTNISWVTGNILEIDPSNPTDNDLTRDVFASGGLDYIFGRMLILGINDWRRYYATTAKSLKPGGIIEHQDISWPFYRVGSSECLSDGWDWCRTFMAACEKTGLSMHAGSQAAPFMEEVGLEVLSVKTFDFAYAPTDRAPNSHALARYVQHELVPIFPELLRKVLESSGTTTDEIGRLTRECMKSLKSEEGLYQNYTVTVARKS